jgi:hypothetical protein
MAALNSVFGLATRRLAKPRPVALAAALLLPLVLSGCGATEGIGGKLLSGVMGDDPKPIDPAVYAATPACPEIGIREGTEFLPIFKKGKNLDFEHVAFQANIQRVARDCDYEGDRLRVRVGAAGRVLSGPKGATGQVSVPIRVAVTIGDRVIYSALSTANAEVQAPDYSGLWSIVDANVTMTVAESHDATIWVGFDGHDGKTKGKAPAKKKPSKS